MRPARIAVALSVAAGFLLGCGGQFDRVHYEMVSPGMTPEQVVDRIGKPDSRTETEWTYRRLRGDRCAAVIRFGGGVVVEKSWSDSPPPEAPGQSWR